MMGVIYSEKDRLDDELLGTMMMGVRHCKRDIRL